MKNVEKLLKAIQVFDCDLTKKRIGNRSDGGYVVAEEICKKIKHMYSFGVGNDLSFELNFLDEFLQVETVNLYDHTIDDPMLNDPRFKFHKRGVGNGYGAFPLVKPDSMMKMGIEWSEWDAIAGIDKARLREFSAILIELHLIHADMSPHTEYFTNVYQYGLNKVNDNIFKAYRDAIEKLTESFYIFHFHANNSLPTIQLGGYQFPPLMELSLIRKDHVEKAEPTKAVFPVAHLDYPNKTDRPDIWPSYPFTKML